ncbi:hypothetical protein TVAG_055890 [Trichomonas vaginalis G3]|uniref:Right handed beta helix domain-containing protein n=1 Tax=Trichomonas vaginalis (strain ATCC PRA-98 / G3) TaxID=412133 RepID=A2EL42_TRIV3|nr:hypothetical protein TVAG_055890 [Trichomonas vaginalis G3]|eukprot:XP_001318818.1 hypothetical protein [Trichomonas vaginalis G3]
MRVMKLSFLQQISLLAKLYNKLLFFIIVISACCANKLNANLDSSLRDDDPWNVYFNSQFIGEETKSCINCNLSPGKGQYYLDECTFYNDNDRVINFSSIDDSLFLHNRCFFSHCTSAEDGSCVYYNVDRNSSIVQRKFCCTKCESSKNGHFSYIKVDPNNINFFIESSLFDVGKEDIGEKAIHAEKDNIIVSSTNFSSCKAPDVATCSLVSQSNNYITTFNYSTVINNKATDGDSVIIEIWYNSLIDSCNIINNTNRQSTIGIIYHQANSLTVKSCSFINNTTPEGSCLIYNNDDQLTVDSCS